MSLEIIGGNRLQGEVHISGAKNSALPILISSLLSDQTIEISNIPDLKDVQITEQILSGLGVNIEKFRQQSNQSFTYRLNTKAISNHIIEDKLVNAMRASVLVLGAMLSRFKEVKMALPGGCAIGFRPINLHIDALKKMGAQINIQDGFIQAKAKELYGTTINFAKISVTGTANIIMAASLAKGQTVINNAAREPEIIDLINLLQKRGVLIKGAGTRQIIIQGVKTLKPASHTIISDRIESATYLLAAALTKAKLLTINANSTHLKAFLDLLTKSGFKTQIDQKGIIIFPLTDQKIKPVNFSTAAYPGFATDLQAPYSILNCLADGDCIIEENIFENRFGHLLELKKMGAKFTIQNKRAYLSGVKSLMGANLSAPDLRAGAALVLAALSAKGKTTINNSYYIDRGYENMVEKLLGLGAQIKRIN